MAHNRSEQEGPQLWVSLCRCMCRGGQICSAPFSIAEAEVAQRLEQRLEQQQGNTESGVDGSGREKAV